MDLLSTSQLFADFLAQRRYLRNVTPSTIEWYETAFKALQHTHGAEQFIYVLQGALRALVAGEESTVREGEVLLVPAGVPHQVEALDDTFVLSVTRGGVHA